MSGRVASEAGRPPRDTLVYRGPSMHPTFQELDLLSYQRNCPVRAGDVVAFVNPVVPRTVVHRVVRVTGRGLVTRGDNAAVADPYLVPVSHVLGVVRWCHRNGISQKVLGGAAGRRTARGHIVSRHGRRVLGAAAGPLYRYMVSRRVISRWTSPLFELRLSAYLRSDGREFQLHHNGRAVGVRSPGAQHWHLDFPYALLVDPDRLPEPLSGETDSASRA